MYNTITNIYADILAEYLSATKLYASDVDPIVINRAKFDTRVLIIARVYVQNKIGKQVKTDKVIKWLETTLQKDSVFVKLINKVPSNLVTIADRYILPINDENLGVIYENLLAIETKGYHVVKGRYDRKALGSYYTPIALAKTLVEKTLLQYVNNTSVKALLSAKIADFSCGAGIFLIEALRYISKFADKSQIKQFAKNIYAYDVDPIALEIALLGVLDYIEDYSLYGMLSNNFQHANFLIHSNKSQSEKTNLSRDGYIYHPELGLNPSKLQKYDIVLGNPPWEKIRIEEKSLYQQYITEITDVNFKFDLKDCIKRYSNIKIDSYTSEYLHHYNVCKNQIKHNPFFAVASHGELNTCTLFTYAAYQLLSQTGVVGLVVKSSILTSPINRDFFKAIKPHTQYVYDFINKKKMFNIDCRERFSLLILNNQACDCMSVGMNILDVDTIDENISKFSHDLLDMLNPETGMLPNIDSSDDLSLLIEIYKNNKVFRTEYPNVKFGRLVHLTNHHQDINKESIDDNIPVYEGKFFNIFDGRYSGFNNIPKADQYRSKATSKPLTPQQKNDGVIPQSRFFIKKTKWIDLSKQYDSPYMLAWRSLTSASNARTCIATILPFMPASQSVQFLTTESAEDLLYIGCIFNSVVFDYIAKCKLSGIDLTQTIVNQIPIPSLSKAQNYYITVEGVKNSIDKWLFQIAKLLLMDDERLNTLLKPIVIEANFLTTYTRKELFDMLNILAIILYDISPNQISVILAKFKDYSSESQIAQFTKKYTELLSNSVCSTIAISSVCPI